MERRIIVATVLSTLIIILWWFIYTPKQTTSVHQKKETVKNEIKQTYTLQDKEPLKTQNIQEFRIESDKWKVVLDTLGARIKHYYIKEDNCNLDNIYHCDLILNPDSHNFATFRDKNFKLIQKKEDDSNHILTFCLDIDKDVKFYKTYIFSKNDFMHKLQLYIENRNDRDNKLLYPVSLSFGPGIGGDKKSKKEEDKIERIIAYQQGTNKRYFAKKLKTGHYSISGMKWIAMDNLYFAMCMIDIDKCFEKAIILKGPNKTLMDMELTGNLISNEPVILPFYFGIKKLDLLKSYKLGLENTIDFGLFAPLSKFFLSCLSFFNKLFHNYGVAIIILAILIQIITIPLTIKSLKSTKVMKALQPKIKEIQEKYKSDPKRLNAEIMYLYRSQKVNPFGGCLPMLLQLPIFWALFNSLRNTYELRNAPFIFWVKDLSSADPYRILPILMGLSMFIQQKITMTEAAEQSQKMFLYVLPVMFTILFLNFPSGLVLYWLVNNILMIGIQYFLLRGK